NRREGPTALILTRQKLSVIDRTRFASAEGLHRGGYILADAPHGEPEVLIIATGSEVHLALGAYDTLVEEGVGVRVVNMPSWEVFETQEAAYQEEILPAKVNARLAIEAAIPMGWERYVGDQGRMIGIERFGASAPGGLVLEKLGFTVEAVVAAVREMLEGSR
ncbi:MAG: transketolase, partial [Deltaproteobacteria bacterium]|nr:transketolase [Deltaproteobacteria bacterium]